MKERDIHQSVSEFLKETGRSMDRNIKEWMKGMQKIAFERTPTADFVFEAEEILFEAQKDRAKE